LECVSIKKACSATKEGYESYYKARAVSERPLLLNAYESYLTINAKKGG